MVVTKLPPGLPSPLSSSSSDGSSSPVHGYKPRPPSRGRPGSFFGRASLEETVALGWDLVRRYGSAFISAADFRRELGIDWQRDVIDPKRVRRVFLDSSGCRYNVVRECAAVMGWDDDPSGAVERVPAVLWLDTGVSHERLMRLRSGTKVNHFPGMTLICRKVEGARHLIKLKKLFPEAYSFVPPTYLDYGEFWNNQTNHSKRQWFILKPNTGCMGKGIRLVKNVTRNMFDGNVVQAYIPRPLLIDGVKWDMRVYALVLSCDPLRVFMFQDGLVRMCTEPYSEPSEGNYDQSLVHLTNYAVQKRSHKFVFNSGADRGDTGTKRDFVFLNSYLRGHDYDPNILWDKVADLIVKTLISVQEHLRHTYRSCFPEGDNMGTACFEILGFDVLVDENLDPWLLEVNQAPSFACDTPLDHKIKRRLVLDAMRLLGVELEEAERQRMRERRVQVARLLTAACGNQYPSAAACLEYRRQERRGGVSRETAAFHQRRTLIEEAARGGYVRVYPCDCPQRMQAYATLIQAGRAAELLGSQLGMLSNSTHGALMTHYAPLRNARQPPATGDRSAALRGLTRNVLLQRQRHDPESPDSDDSWEISIASDWEVRRISGTPAPASRPLPSSAAASSYQRPAPPAAGTTAPLSAVLAAVAAALAAAQHRTRGSQPRPPDLCSAACLQCTLCVSGRLERCTAKVRRLQQLLDDALRERAAKGAAAKYGDLRRVAERSSDVAASLDDVAWGPDWDLTGLEWRELIRRAAVTARGTLRVPSPVRRPSSAPATVSARARAPRRPAAGPPCRGAAAAAVSAAAAPAAASAARGEQTAGGVHAPSGGGKDLRTRAAARPPAAKTPVAPRPALRPASRPGSAKRVNAPQRPSPAPSQPPARRF